MKTLNKSLLTLAAIFLFSAAYSQTRVAELNYMKVKPGNWNEYLEVEKEWKNVHQERINQGKIILWELFEKVGAGEGDPYNFITVAIFDDYNKTENSMPWKWMKENYTEAEWDALMKRTMESRKQVKNETYFNFVAVENPAEIKYIILHWIDLHKEWAYRNLVQEYALPVNQEMVNSGKRANWSSWSRFLPGNESKFLAVEGYSEYGQWVDIWSDMQETFKIVFPDEELSEVMVKFGEARTHGNSELWRLVDIVKAGE